MLLYPVIAPATLNLTCELDLMTLTCELDLVYCAYQKEISRSGLSEIRVERGQTDRQTDVTELRTTFMGDKNIIFSCSLQILVIAIYGVVYLILSVYYYYAKGCFSAVALRGLECVHTVHDWSISMS